jgi:hypothetical protein
VAPLATVPTPIAARGPLRDERSKTTAKNARVDARERRRWLVRKRGVPRRFRFLTGGPVGPPPATLTQLEPSLRAPARHLIRCATFASSHPS